MLFRYFRTKWEDFKARRRGERRVAPSGERGRVYSRANEEGGASLRVGARPKAQLEMKVIRADGTVEHITKNAEVIGHG